jgi:hypothetical protein
MEHELHIYLIFTRERELRKNSRRVGEGESHGKNERHFTVDRERASFVSRFPSFALSSF